MQPTPSEHSPPTAIETDASDQSNQPHQHGHIVDRSATPPFSGDESGGVAVPLYDAVSSEQPSSLGGLSPPHTPTQSAIVYLNTKVPLLLQLAADWTARSFRLSRRLDNRGISVRLLLIYPMVSKSATEIWPV